MCTYNGAAYLQQQLESILHQSMQANELVICDDGSSDKTIALISNFKHRFPGSLLLHQNQQQLGPRANFEKAISLCTGDIIFLCDQDDAWLPGKISEMVTYLQKHPAAGAVFCNGYLMDENNHPLHETMWDALYLEPDLLATLTPANMLRYILLNGNIVTGTALAFRRSELNILLPLADKQHTWHDHWFAICLAAVSKLHILNRNLLHYRIHQRQEVGFPGRNRSNPAFRNAVRACWLSPTGNDPEGVRTTHFAWALQTWERFSEVLPHGIPNSPHWIETGRSIKASLNFAKRSWIRHLPLLHRKIKLAKHWISGGEYLRISFKDLVTI